MTRIYRIAAGAAALILLATAGLGAQQRALVVSVYGGIADHLADLTPSPPLWFMPGYSAGASVGVQLTRTLALHGDFDYTRNPTEGSTLFAGEDVNRFFYGVHAELRYPMPHGVTPFVFAGVGAVSIDQLGLDTFSPTTRPALTYGGGFFYNVARTRLDLVGEIKGLTYNWNMVGYNRTMVDVTFNAGLSYRMPF